MAKFSKNVAMMMCLLLCTSQAAKAIDFLDVVMGAAAVVAAPYAIGALGFTSVGIAAGSVASSLMSSAATTGMGAGVVATLQSAGATGLTLLQSALIGSAGASASSFARDDDDRC